MMFMKKKKINPAIKRVSRTRYGGKKRKGKRKTKKRRKRKRRKKTKKGKGKNRVRMDRTKKRKRLAMGIAPNEEAKIATRKLYENIKREELEKKERNKTISRLYTIDTELARYFPDRVRTYPEEENEIEPAVKANK